MAAYIEPGAEHERLRHLPCMGQDRDAQVKQALPCSLTVVDGTRSQIIFAKVCRMQSDLERLFDMVLQASDRNCPIWLNSTLKIDVRHQMVQ